MKEVKEMEDHIKKKIQDIVNLYGNTILLREGYFENVFRAVIEKSDGHIITLKNKGGGRRKTTL